VAEFEIVRELKENVCYVAVDFEFEKKMALETTVLSKTYTLPDGRVIRVDRERFDAPEALFHPRLVGKDGAGMSEMIMNSILACDRDLRTKFYSTIVLSGGSTMYPGLPSRIEHDVRELYKKLVVKGDEKLARKLKLNIEDPPRRRHMVFTGGAVLADLIRNQDSMWVTRAEYQEHGINILAQKRL
jgi:actin-related protein 2